MSKQVTTETDQLPDEQNPRYMFQTTHSSLLIACVQRRLNLFKAAQDELKSRGYDHNGEYVGFGKK